MPHAPARSPPTILPTVAFLLLLMTSARAAAAPAPGEADDLPDKPNILYVLADDLGYGDLGCYGQERIRTPHIDRLAASGMRFTDHYSGHTVCRPSRLVLWTGLHSGRTPIDANEAYRFENDETTVAELLKKAGYATGGIGKWAMGGVGTPGHPNRNGFDYWFGYLDQSAAHNYYPAHLWENERKVPLPGNELLDHPQARGRVADPEHRVTYSHDVMTEKALEWIRKRAEEERPFLFHAHYTIPHANNEGGRVTGNGLEVPDHGRYAGEEWPDVEKGFAAMITRLDRDVGRIVELLEELEIRDETLVIFTSDNGPHREGGHDHTFFDSNGPLRGYKRDLYEGGIRVPFIASWPGVVPRASTSDHPSCFYDFLPTACELAGVEPPDAIDGISCLPALRGRPDEQKTHEYLFWQFHRGNRQRDAVRMGKWKAVRYGLESPVELYDLEADIGEEKDVAKGHPGLVERARRIIERFRD